MLHFNHSDFKYWDRKFVTPDFNFHVMKVLTAGLVALLAVSASAQSSATVYSVATTIPWSPKVPSSVDQSVVYNSTYYLSYRTNAGVSICILLWFSCKLTCSRFDRFILSPLLIIHKPNLLQVFILVLSTELLALVSLAQTVWLFFRPVIVGSLTHGLLRRSAPSRRKRLHTESEYVRSILWVVYIQIF
jgi:hypothetical protein